MVTRVARCEIECGEESKVAVPSPRLSWSSTSDVSGWKQLSAEVEWTSGEHTSVHRFVGTDQRFLPWPFQDLRPRQEGVLRVRVKGVDGWSPWSEPVPLFAVFLGPGEWRASGIEFPSPEEEATPFLARSEFSVEEGLERATLYGTALGVYQAEINGVAVDDQVLKPGWTPYQSRLIHETTDVSDLLVPGTNVLGLAVAGGWFTEKYGFGGLAHRYYGTQPCVAAQLFLEYSSGRREWVTTSKDWKTSDQGPWVSSGIYAGEHYDARREVPGWSSIGFDDSSWSSASERSELPVPVARTSPKVRVTEHVPALGIAAPRPGHYVVDFGQNVVGRVRIRIPRGATAPVRLRHAEVLVDGELALRPLRYADATDKYVPAGLNEVHWSPSFTYHGFRYVEVTGWPGDLGNEDIVAEVIRSDMRRTGWFECSDPRVNRLHENVVWGMKGNFLYVPTDCPQRDERLGWTGDIQVFGPTASFIYDCDGFLASWLADVALEQKREGGMPFVVPDVLDSSGRPTAGWGDVATLLPWTLYQRFGDRRVLADQYDSARSWVEEVLGRVGDDFLWETGFQFGDWVDPDAPSDAPGKAKTNSGLIATAYLFRSCTVLASIAEVLGVDDDQARYSGIAEKVRKAWLDEYVTPAGRVMSDAQTGYAVAIVFGLVRDDRQLRAMGDRLATLARENRFRISTGFLGTPLVADALSMTGHIREAGRMLLTDECPSWLYPIRMGATTIWERWDSLLEDGTVNSGEMTSFNHYALGAIADWLHRVLGGLASGAPGYSRIRVEPKPIAGIEWVRVSHDTPYGVARVEWSRANGTMTTHVEIPANAHADVVMPDGSTMSVSCGEHTFVCADPVVPVEVPDLGPTSALSDIMDDEESYRTVIDAIDRVLPGEGASFANGRSWIAGEPLFNPTSDLPPRAIDAVSSSLRELNQRRAESGRG